ncbi:MAG: hypothetical protein ACFFD4_35715 [Candidatus Odinarchaeota archaeon]
MSPKMRLFKQEKSILEDFLLANKNRLSNELAEIFDTFYDLLINSKNAEFGTAVKEFDLEKLRGFMSRKADKFLNSFNRGNKKKDLVLIEKNAFYYTRYHSISFTRNSITRLYPFLLISAVNYHNFIPLLCRDLERIDSPLLHLEHFFDTYLSLLKLCKPAFTEQDIKLLQELTALDFTKIGHHSFQKYDADKHYRRLNNLGVVSFSCSINYPALRFVPYMHYSTNLISVPEYLQPFIEIESHPAKTKQEHVVFRLFLIPEAIERKLAPAIDLLGMADKLEEWFVSYSWNSLVHTKRSTWKWKLDFSDLEVESGSNPNRFDRIFFTEQPRKLNYKFISYLETVHRLGPVNTDELVDYIGFSEEAIRKYQQIALKDRIIIPYWLLSQIGSDSYYEVSFKNHENNQKLATFLENMPKVKAMKSKNFSRYIVYLPEPAVRKLDHLLQQKEKQGEIDLHSKYVLGFSRNSIINGVNLIETINAGKKRREDSSNL